MSGIALTPDKSANSWVLEDCQTKSLQKNYVTLLADYILTDCRHSRYTPSASMTWMLYFEGINMKFDSHVFQLSGFYVVLIA